MNSKDTKPSEVEEILVTAVKAYAQHDEVVDKWDMDVVEAIDALSALILKSLPELLDKYDLHKNCQHERSLEWAQGHNDGYYDTVNAIKSNLRDKGIRI